MIRRTAWFFFVTPRDGSAKRVIFYATSKAEALRYASAWAERLGYEVELEERVA